MYLMLQIVKLQTSTQIHPEISLVKFTRLSKSF